MKHRTYHVEDLTRPECAAIRAAFVGGEAWEVTVTGPWHRLNALRTSMLAWANRTKWVVSTTLHRTAEMGETSLLLVNGGPLYVKERKLA